MARHQHGIFAEGTNAHHHLELTIDAGASDDEIRAALAGVRQADQVRRTNGGTNLVIGLGPALAARLGVEAPELVAFPGYATSDGTAQAPATQRDLWVWAHGPTPDLVLDVVRRALQPLSSIATVALDQPGFVYHDSRDLTGFIDGTANPPLDEAVGIAVVADGQPGAGSAYAMTMRFEHHLDRFEALPVAEQEQVFGRTKLDGEELESDAKAPDAHISRVEVDDEAGEELKVYRRSVPWGTATAQGLHFVAFGCDVHRFDLQLRHQYGLVDDGITDRLLAFTTPETGSFWVCPSVDDLDRLAPLPTDD